MEQEAGKVTGRISPARQHMTQLGSSVLWDYARDALREI